MSYPKLEPVCFVDCDGVLANFTDAALRLHGFADRFKMADMDWGFTPLAKAGGPTVDSPAFWKDMGREFWASLDWTPEGKELFWGIVDIFGPNSVCILTSPCDTDGCRDGKIDWIRKHLPGYEKRTYMGQDKRPFAGPSKVLVDDNDNNCDQFAIAGGNPVRVPRPWNSFAPHTYPDGSYNPRDVLAYLRIVHQRIR